MMKITILVENTAEKPLLAEHGFACWIEADSTRILFDTGQSAEVLFHNAKMLGIDLSTADMLVLSHGHYDHTGGLPEVLTGNPALEVYAHLDVLKPRYNLQFSDNPKPIDMPKASRTAFNAVPSERMHWVEKSLELLPGIGMTGPVPRDNDFEDTGGKFFFDPEGAEVDPVLDDQALWTKTNQGLVIVAGCSHAGIINTIRHIKQITGEDRVHAVIGGFHLKHASSARLKATAAEMEKVNMDILVPCHCTGEKAVSLLKSRLGGRICSCTAGKCFAF